MLQVAVLALRGGRGRGPQEAHHVVHVVGVNHAVVVHIGGRVGAVNRRAQVVHHKDHIRRGDIPAEVYVRVGRVDDQGKGGLNTGATGIRRPNGDLNITEGIRQHRQRELVRRVVD